MTRPLFALPADHEFSPAVRAKHEAYTNQGGLLGAFAYALVALETDSAEQPAQGTRFDDDLDAAIASVPTALFVTSSLHDDAIDEADAWDDDRKRRLNEHITLGDLVFIDVVEVAGSLPEGVDLESVLGTVRRIGTGQLREEALAPTTATLEDAIARVDERGAVWGDLAVSLIDAIDGYSAAQLERLRTITTNGMFVLTVVDDVEDLPEDVDNGVVNVPLALYDGETTETESAAAVAESFLESDAPRRIDALLADRWADLEAGAREFAASLDRSDEAILEAVRRGLSWYCESVCSVPLERTVPPARQREIRAQLASDELETRRVVEAVTDELPITSSLDDAETDCDADGDRAALENRVDELPVEPLAEVLIMLVHVATVADGVMSTSLADALDALERRTTATTS
ncbi:class 1 isoprenoid biosynthesis enzyme [Natronorubrum halophilum]|uniref:class 1 isoprenoid biosynthesis enzyme n=1 Tax=Natronorubrum halophilum TaxID=1702106 RepID=UPI000EF729FA|nr:class 1 isoprenoid biosynthesis enzyme [Natronorubrum halophilum]